MQKVLPQSTVLTPVLFNIYSADILETTLIKFTYADDLALVTMLRHNHTPK